MTKLEIWINLDRMQKACMDEESQITAEEFFSESTEEQKAYYNWMRKQVGPITAGSIGLLVW